LKVGKVFLFFRNLKPKRNLSSKGENMAKKQSKASSPQKGKDAQRESFLFQLDVLKLEMQTLESIVARMDEMAQAAKNWGITIWTGSIALTLSQPELRKFVIISAIPPFLFWYIDAYFRRLQTRSILRGRKIQTFLNSDDLVSSFEKNKLVNFIVNDATGTQYKGTEEYKRFTSLKRTLRYPEVMFFYLVPILISIIIGVFFLLTL
jgi:hypothetical protein